MSCPQGTRGKHNIKAANKTLRKVAKFKYLGIKVTILITFTKERADLIIWNVYCSSESFLFPCVF
jgi:hypothetical protein